LHSLDGEQMSDNIIKVGCCGFSTARTKYFHTFSVIEIQQTFYQPPRLDTVKRWRDEAPADFEFTMKAWQLITHEASSPTYRRLKMRLSERQKQQVGAFRSTDTVLRAWETTLGIARLLHADKVVFQCPASFAPTSDNKDRMREFFSRIDRNTVTCIWEPRGKWSDEEISMLCRELDLIHCVDPFKTQCVTDGLRYYRLHGISGYRHKYTDPELNDLAQYVSEETPNYFMFNNVSMWHDAIRLKELLK
jgi:uncharacterized protein YecE (DUF72 family)